jgi:hypothetical protein
VTVFNYVGASSGENLKLLVSSWNKNVDNFAKCSPWGTSPGEFCQGEFEESRGITIFHQNTVEPKLSVKT